MKRKKILWFFLGAICFVVSQPLLRLPLLQRLQQSTGFTLAYTLNPILIGILIALSAGVFEEGFRFLFKAFLLKPSECEFNQPIIFGLGHGVAEACIILIPVIATIPFSQLTLAVIERMLAIILHITLTVMVWNGFQGKRRMIYLLSAIIVHGLVNAMIPVFSSFSNSILLIEVGLLVVDVFMVIYAYSSKKYYISGRVNDEESKN